MALLLLTIGCTSAKTSVDQEATEVADFAADDADLPVRELPTIDDAIDPPLALTASDGTGLRLVAMKVRSVVQGPLAFTELHLTFENPVERVIEGQFTIDLPTDAAISRFAMKIGGHWQEGEVVERQAARVVYEDFLHRKQDPALLENQAGNRFSARVFPIPARGTKELVLSYSQELVDAGAPFAIRLAGLPEMDSFDAQIAVEDRDPIRLQEKNYAPEKDLVVPLAADDEASGLRNGELAVARVRAVGTMPEMPVEDLTILFDTSASRSLGFAGQIHRLGEIVAALRERADLRLRVITFDQEVTLQFDGDARDFGSEHLTAIYSRRALGASDLAGALDRVAHSKKTSPRVLLVSDGVTTAGDADLRAAVSALRQSGVVRLDAVVDGGLQDREALLAMTTADLEHTGLVIDGRLPADAIAERLGRATLAELAIEVPGSEFSWPKTIRGVQSGDDVLVYAQLPESAAMSVVLGGEDPVDVEFAGVERPLIERALAGARIDALTQQLSGLGEGANESRARLTKRIVELSTKHRVLSDFTALLVLETEADYASFKIDRDALADIMTIGKHGIELVDRPKPAAAAQGGILQAISGGGQFVDPNGAAFAVGNDDEDVWGGLAGTEIGEAFGVGGLGLVGTGRGGGGTTDGTIGLGNIGLLGSGGGGTGSGYGRGAGAGFGGRGVRVPMVRQAKPTVHGALDKDIIRRIVRAHLNEVRHCYNQGLVRDPSLAGRVSVQFTISPLGRVPVAVVAESSLRDPSVGNCIAKAVKRWQFPKPANAGNVVVTYPFVVAPVKAPSRDELEAQRRANEQRLEQERADRASARPYEGRMREIMDLIDVNRAHDALAAATRWRDESPGDVIALIAMGEALEAVGRTRSAARVYGSLIDLFPSRADLRRYAGSRLEKVGQLELAIDTYRHAVEQRPDHPNSHRLYAYALLRDGRPRKAFDAIAEGADRDYPRDRFAGVDRILAEDVGLIAAAWIRAERSEAPKIRSRVELLGAAIPNEPSTRFVMSWETDANDVDFHIYDRDGSEAYYGAKDLPSGGSLYADVTTGYGPECFTIEGNASAFPYRFEALYFSRGPMGYGMGKLQIVEHDGKGGLLFEDRPFLIMNDRASVRLGIYEQSLTAAAARNIP